MAEKLLLKCNFGNLRVQLAELRTSSGVLLGGGRQLKYSQFSSLVSSSFNCLTEKEKEGSSRKIFLVR